MYEVILYCRCKSYLNELPGWMAIDDIHLEFEYNFFTISCLAKSYTRTTFCVCTVNKNCS